MSNRFASNKIAIAECDICGFQYKLRELRNLIVKDRDTNLKACIECWEPDHPQLKLGEFPVDDPQAIRDPRPDRSLGASGDNSSRDIYWGWNPVGGGANPYNLTPNPLQAVGAVGDVTVTTS
jgi:hypothetical protein|tara:strand:+ start:1079 stop:1444 length:366 start_codon:yes stop_codon:yes gene_type:complete